MTVTIGSLFSGIGALDMGVELAFSDRGVRHALIYQVERDVFCRKILKAIGSWVQSLPDLEKPLKNLWEIQPQKSRYPPQISDFRRR